MNAMAHNFPRDRIAVAGLPAATRRALAEMGVGPAQQCCPASDGVGRSERSPVKRNRLEEADVIGIVRRWADSFRSEAAAARAAGVKRQTLNQQRNAVRPLSDKVLKAAGLRRIVTVHYEFIEDSRP